MNNRGQVLILFILIIPCLLLVMAFVVDLGILYQKSKHLEYSVKDGLYYGLNNLDDEKNEERIKELIKENVENIKEINVYNNEDYLQINVKINYNGMFDFLFKNNIYELESTYYGYVSDGDLVVNKE